MHLWSNFLCCPTGEFDHKKKCNSRYLNFIGFYESYKINVTSPSDFFLELMQTKRCDKIQDLSALREKCMEHILTDKAVGNNFPSRYLTDDLSEKETRAITRALNHYQDWILKGSYRLKLEKGKEFTSKRSERYISNKEDCLHWGKTFNS